MTSTGSSYADDISVSEVIDKDKTSYGADLNGDSTFYNLTLSGDAESSKISDSDDSNYYVDPNDTSVFNVIEGNGTVPIGGIITWSGAESAIPDGWALCDGSTVSSYQTPDLRDQFIMGAGSTYSVSHTGGSHTAALASSNLPDHDHSISISSISDTHTHPVSTDTPSSTHKHWIQAATTDDLNFSHTNTFNQVKGLAADAGDSPINTNSTGGESSLTETANHTHTLSNGNSVSEGIVISNLTQSSSLSGSSFSIKPSYYALAYIIRIQ